MAGEEYRVWRSPVVAVVVCEAEAGRQLMLETLALGWEGAEDVPSLEEGARVLGVVAPPPGIYRVLGDVLADDWILDPAHPEERRAVRRRSPTWALGYVVGTVPLPADDSEWEQSAVVEWRDSLDEEYGLWKHRRAAR